MEAAALAERPSALDLAGISHLVVEVGDLDKAVAFYSRVLGLKPIGTNILPGCGEHAALKCVSGQWVALVSNPARLDLREMGVHQAYRVSAAARAAIADRLAAEGIEVKSYKEDRSAEDGDNFYFFDPDGLTVEYSFGMEQFAETGPRQATKWPYAPESFDVWDAPKHPNYPAIGGIEQEYWQQQCLLLQMLQQQLQELT